jgi:predicted signal transduction protein with EAL and GGDEF domain
LTLALFFRWRSQAFPGIVTSIVNCYQHCYWIAVLLPSASVDQALSMANAIRDRIRARAIPHQGSLVSDRVTLSIGLVVGIPHPSESAADFVARADHALYEAKQQGRNRVVVLDDSAPVLRTTSHS